MDIYIHRNGEQHGPYSVDQVREHLASGELTPDDLAWHEGAAEWLPLQQVIEGVEAAEGPVAEPEPEHVDAPELEHQPELEPEPEAEPEPEPPPVRPAQPSWVPPRRDGMNTPPRAFAQPTRIPMPGQVASPAPAPASTPFPSASPKPSPAPVRQVATPSPAVSARPAISEAKAQAMARRQLASRAAARPSRPKPLQSVLINGCIFFIGLVVTVFSYEEAASSPGGGTYFVAWGAMLFGGIRFVWGLVLLFGD